MNRISIFVTIALLFGLFFFSSLDNLWPLVDRDLAVEIPRAENRARAAVERQGFDLTGYLTATNVRVAESTIDFIESEFSSTAAAEILGNEPGLAVCDVEFKKPGVLRTYSVSIGVGGAVQSLRISPGEEEFCDSISAETARTLAESSVAKVFGVDLSAESSYRRAWSGTNLKRLRQDHNFSYERVISDTPLLRERISVEVSGATVTSYSRALLLPEDEHLKASARTSSQDLLTAIGEFLRGLGILAALVVALGALKEGSISIRRAAIFAALVFCALAATQLVRTPDYFRSWNQFADRRVEYPEIFLGRMTSYLAVGAAFLILALAADAVDRFEKRDSSLRGCEAEKTISAGEGVICRGESLSRLLRGRIFDPLVARASRNGFFVGLLCGGAIAAGTLLLVHLAGGRVSLQPRGFFLFAMNSTAPFFALITFFFFVAATEEVGYRYFGTGWIIKRTGRTWLAVGIPALVYGLAHASYGFLPPAEPFWARAFVLTIVGAVWGWAFLRFDALTVILSHYTADLFIFSWPWLASGDRELVIGAVLVIAVPLIPALGGLLFRTRRASSHIH